MNKIKWFLNLPFVAKFVNHALGGYVTTGLAAAFSYVPKWLGVDFTPDTQHTITMVAMAAAAGLVQYVQTGNAKALQDALGVEPDGFIGPQTILKATLATDADVTKTLGTNYTATEYRTAAGK